MSTSTDHESPVRRRLKAAAWCLTAVGAAGFFGSAMSATGGLDGLPKSFEWPMGFATNVVSTPEGVHVAPHCASGRIQVYSADWTFLRGWRVDAGGGAFKLLTPAAGRIDMFTARGQWHCVFDLDGRLISRDSYAPKSYNDFPDEGESLFISTPIWLWTFTHPFISWIVGMIGIVTLGVLGRADKRRVES